MYVYIYIYACMYYMSYINMCAIYIYIYILCICIIYKCLYYAIYTYDLSAGIVPDSAGSTCDELESDSKSLSWSLSQCSAPVAAELL